MDDDPLLAEESDEEFRKMENDIDEFLSSIRENVSKNYPQSKATCSRVANEYDSISSDDLENQSSYNSVNNEPGLSRQPRKFNHNSSLNKKKQGWKQKKQGWRQKKWKDHGAVQKQWRSNSQEEKHDLKGKRFRQSSNKSYSHHPQDSFSPKEDDEYRWSPSLRRRDEFHLERSPRRNAYHHERTGFPRGRVEYFEELSLSPQERGYQEERKGRYGHKRRFSPERIEEQEHSQDSVIFDENFTCQHRTSGSRSSEMESIYHKIYAEESDSPSCWSEDEENYDYRDQHTDPHWKHEGDDLFMEDEDDYGSSAGSINTASFVTACLEKIVVSNPEIAEKFSNACMSLLNKSVGTTCDSDYEYEESSCGSFADQSGRISARNWRNSRSPSFSGGPPGPRNYRDRHEGSSRRIVVEYSQSPSPDRGHCSRYDQKRHTAPSSPTLSTKRRYSFNHHKSGREEDPKTSVIRSIKKIRKQCEEESNSTVRRALLALLKVHQKECDMYLRKPEAHPDYIKEYRVFLDKKSRSIIDLGGDPNDYDFQENWKKYWPTQLARLFRQSWDTKMHKCTSMLLKKGHLSKSLSTSSSKEVTSQPHKKKKGSKDTSEKNSEVKNQEHQKLEASSAAQCKTKKEEMDTELLNILKLLNHIKHKFKDCEASFDSFYQKALSFKQKNLDLSGILSSNLSLLEKIDTKLEETLEDEDLTLIQKAIIKETHERFQCFLKKSKESNSHVMKNYNDRNQVVAEEHHIECLVTDLHPSVVTSLHTKKVIPAVTCRTRTLTEISIQKPEIQQAPLTMTQEKHSHSDLTQPPPPGVTPPPPGVTPPPPGVTPPPLGVTPPPPGVTPPPLGVTPPFQSVSSPPSGVTPLSGTVITSLSHSVTSSINTECAKSPHHTTPAPSCNISIPLHIPASSPGVMPPPPGITPPPPGVTPPPPGVTPPPPGVTLPPPPLVSSSPPTTLSHQSLIIVPSQRSFPASKSLPVSNLPKSHDAAPKVTEHPSTTSTSAVQRSKPINNKDIIPVSQKQTQRIHQKSREFLRSTIKDCFLSTSSPIEERNLSTSTEEESITPDSKAGESAASSIPTLTEDILKMFVVKLEDKSETIAGNKSCDELNTSVVDTKPATKKRIKITIPQSSEKKRMPALNPILDDQELL